MLHWRLIGTAAIIAPILLLLWLDNSLNFGRPGIWLLPIGFLLAAAMSAEFHQLGVADGERPRDPFWKVALAMGTLAIGSLPIVLPSLAKGPPPAWAWTVAAIMVVVMVRMILAMRDFRVSTELTQAVAVDTFQVIYAVVPLMCLLHLRLTWPDARGLWAMASIPWITKMSDAGAYFVGKQFGRVPMAPYLSPKKTWEGAIGGLLWAILASVAYFLTVRHLLDPPLALHVSWMSMVAFALVLAVTGMLGDLAESLLKRDAGCKDSSAWLPGLGGTLDVMDSILWTAPIGYFCWLVWLDPQINT